MQLGREGCVAQSADGTGHQRPGKCPLSSLKCVCGDLTDLTRQPRIGLLAACHTGTGTRSEIKVRKLST
jgi:hypothetical protein